MIVHFLWLPNAVAIAPWPGLIVTNWFQWRTLSEVEKLALIAHEWRHHQQQKRDGWFTFMWRYATSCEWRRRYEEDADMKQQIVLEKLNG